MQRFRLTIEYDGTGFKGWQKLPDISSVQEAMEEAVFRFCGERTEVYAAGRTDAGVHAVAMTAHVDIAKPTTGFRLQQAVNFHLQPHAIVITHAEEAPEGFHARFSCLERQYQYRILSRRPRAALAERFCWHIPTPLDISAMKEAAALMRGHHDFTSFRSSECTAASAEKTLHDLQVIEEKEWISIQAASRSFLHHQVRIITGTLVEVGLGKRPPGSIPDIFAARKRSAAGQTAPPQGLFFIAARYNQ